MTQTHLPAAEHLHGLSSAEVAARVESGQANGTTTGPSRTLKEILRANVLTRFNAILGALLVVILLVGPIQDALFGLVILANSGVGIVQELRAKRTLDRLRVLNMPTATVVRDGQVTEVPASEVVVDDTVVLGRGDQVVVDGTVSVADRLEVDESLLTGEADPVLKRAGEEILSGSFVVAGDGRIRATRVGDRAYAVALTTEARRFSLVHSEIRDDLNQLLKVITWVLVPTAGLLVATQLLVEQESWQGSVRGAVAGVVGMVPEGLVLLTSVAFAVGIVRLGRRGVLVQELPAIEGLARVDVVGIDKTGTLTEGRMTVQELVPLDGDPVCAADALGAMARAEEHPNASMLALAEEYAAPTGWVMAERVPFSSARKWSGATFEGHGGWVLGAPEMLLEPASPALEAAQLCAASGRRVLVLARAERAFGSGHTRPPSAPTALVVLSERLRPDAAETLRYFGEEDVAVKVISGDSPRTVAAVAGALGLPGADHPVDARGLGEDDRSLGEVMEQNTVFGRVAPQQKRAMVAALQQRGHVVAMTGDGVNDVLALKGADIGVAMGSGAPAARAVAALVLMRNHFDVLPDVVGEGRRVIANIERVAHLFLTKTVYVALIAVATGVAQLPFPFYPRHLTIISTLTIGIPAFFLALAPNRQRAASGFLSRVLRFAVPAGAVAAAATFAAYAVTLLETDHGPGVARTAATVVLFGVGATVLALLMVPLTRSDVLLLGGVVACFAGLLAVPGLREFFALSLLPVVVWVSIGAVLGLSVTALRLVWQFSRVRP